MEFPVSVIVTVCQMSSQNFEMYFDTKLYNEPKIGEFLNFDDIYWQYKVVNLKVLPDGWLIQTTSRVLEIRLKPEPEKTEKRSWFYRWFVKPFLAGALDDLR